MDDCRRKFVAFCLVLTISVSQLLGSVANLCDCDLHSNQSHLHLDTHIECSPAWMADHDDHKDDHPCLSDLITQEAYNTHAFDVSPSHDEHPPHGMIVVLAIDWYWMDSTIIFSSHTHSFARHSSNLCLNCPGLDGCASHLLRNEVRPKPQAGYLQLGMALLLRCDVDSRKSSISVNRNSTPTRTF